MIKSEEKSVENGILTIFQCKKMVSFHIEDQGLEGKFGHVSDGSIYS